MNVIRQILIITAFIQFNSAFGQAKVDKIEHDTSYYAIDWGHYDINAFRLNSMLFAIDYPQVPYSYEYIDTELETANCNHKIITSNGEEFFKKIDQNGVKNCSETLNTEFTKSGKIYVNYFGDSYEIPIVERIKKKSWLNSQIMKFDNPSSYLAELLPDDVTSFKIKIDIKTRVVKNQEAILSNNNINTPVNYVLLTNEVSYLASIRRKDRSEDELLSQEQAELILDRIDLILNRNYSEYILFHPLENQLLCDVKFRDNEIFYSKFRRPNNPSDLKIINKNTKEYLLFPNPTYDELNVDIIGLPSDYYTVSVKNILGKSLFTSLRPKFPVTSIDLNLDFLVKGPYLLSIFDGNGHKLTTRRIAIIGQ